MLTGQLLERHPGFGFILSHQVRQSQYLTGIQLLMTITATRCRCLTQACQIKESQLGFRSVIVSS